MRNSSKRILAALLVCLLFHGASLDAAENESEQPPAPGTAEAPPKLPPARPLSDLRETDRAYGISLKPPTGTRVVRDPTGKYLMQIADEDNKFAIRLSVQSFRTTKSLDAVVDSARELIATTPNLYSQLEVRAVMYHERPGELAYYKVAEPRVKLKKGAAGYRLVGQAILQIARNNFAVVELESPIEEEKDARSIFEAVLDSLEFSDVEKLEAERAAAVKRAGEFLSRLKPEDVRAALIPDRYYRIVETPANGGKPRDVGWTRTLQYSGELSALPGVFVESVSRDNSGPVSFHTYERYFRSDDNSFESWKIDTARRTGKAGGKPKPNALSPVARPDIYVETGFRTDAKIKVQIEGSQEATYDLVRPDSAYLSQVDALLLPQLLPPDQPGVYGFYHFHRLQKKITLRTDHLVPKFTGYTLTTYPSLNEPPHKSESKQGGKVIERGVTPTRTLIPTTKQELDKLWPNEDK